MKTYFYYYTEESHLSPEGLMYVFEFDSTLFLLPLIKGFVVYNRELKQWELEEHKLKAFGKMRK
jgi:hypothetical protein